MSDPKPFLQDPSLGGDLRSVLESASAHEPTPADLASLAKKLAGVLPPPGGGGGGAAASGGGLKLAAATLAIAAVGVGLYVAGGPRGDVAREPAPSSSAVASASAIASSSSPLLLEPVTEASANASASASAVLPPAPPPAEPEGTMLARAHAALLRGAPDQALALTAEHAKAYPRGALAQERDVITIQALLQSGKRAEAEKRAAAFRAAYPGSSHQERVDRLLAPR